MTISEELDCYNHNKATFNLTHSTLSLPVIFVLRFLTKKKESILKWTMSNEAIVDFFVDRWDWRRLCYSTNYWARSEYPATSRWQFSASKLTVHQWERGAGAADATTESHAAESGVSPATSRWLFSEWRSGQSRSLMV